MKHQRWVVILAVLAACVCGCGNSAKLAQTAPDALAGADSEAMMAAAQETLGRMSFILDKYDVEAGYIRTRPMRGGQFFEPWRQDNASARAFGQSNLGSIRRTVEVFVEPENGQAQLRCVVTVEKLSLPSRPMRSMSAMAGMHTESNQSVQTLALTKEQMQKMEWVGLGPDHALEHRITARIQKQLNKG